MELKLSDLIPDDKNYNKGNEFGNSLVKKSLRKLGAGRSILLDKNNRIIAGNKTVENAGVIGLQDVIIVETTGNQIVAVKRTDIDLDSKLGREMALADNATAKANIEWDTPLLSEDWGKNDLEDWGIQWKEEKEQEEPSGYDQQLQWFVNIRCDNEQQTQELYERFINEGLDVKIVT